MTLGPALAPPVDPSCAVLDAQLRRRGVWILAGFGAMWGLVGAAGLGQVVDGPVGPVVTVAVVVAALGVVLGAHRRAGDPALARLRTLPEKWGRIVGITNGCEVVAILATVLVLVRLDLDVAIPGAVAIVVGLHFWPLARAFDQPQYRVTALAMSLLGVVALGLAIADVEAAVVQALAGLACATALLGSAAHVGLRG